jgi:hypothetical protein
MSQGHSVADPTSSFTPVLTQALAATNQRLKRHAKQGLEFRFKEVNSSSVAPNGSDGASWLSGTRGRPIFVWRLDLRAF